MRNDFHINMVPIFVYVELTGSLVCVEKEADGGLYLIAFSDTSLDAVKGCHCWGLNIITWLYMAPD